MPPAEYPLDSNDVFNWRFNESTGLYLNSGNGGAQTLQSVVTGGVIDSCGGLFSNCVELKGPTSHILGPQDNTANIATNNLTLSAWVNIRQNNNWPYAYVLMKRYSNSGWNPQFATAILSVNGSGGLNGLITTGANGAGAYSQNATDAGVVPFGEWTHIGMTFTSADQTVRLYRDGVQVYSFVAGSATIDWNTGATTGGWSLGEPWTSTGGSIPFRVTGARVSKVARDAAWFMNVYKYGWGRYYT